MSSPLSGPPELPQTTQTLATAQTAPIQDVTTAAMELFACVTVAYVRYGIHRYLLTCIAKLSFCFRMNIDYPAAVTPLIRCSCATNLPPGRSATRRPITNRGLDKTSRPHANGGTASTGGLLAVSQNEPASDPPHLGRSPPDRRIAVHRRRRL